MKPEYPIEESEGAWEFLEPLQQAPKSDRDFGLKIYLDVPLAFAGSGQWFTLWSADRYELVEKLRYAWLYIWHLPNGEYPADLQPELNRALMGHEHHTPEELKKIFNEHSVVSVIDWFCTYGELKSSDREWARAERDWVSQRAKLEPHQDGWEDAFKDYLINTEY